MEAKSSALFIFPAYASSLLPCASATNGGLERHYTYYELTLVGKDYGETFDLLVWMPLALTSPEKQDAGRMK